MEFINIAGVEFYNTNKIYNFGIGSLKLKVGDYVIVESERGQATAKVVYLKYKKYSTEEKKDLKIIIRIAEKRDLVNESKFSESKILSFVKEKIEKLNLKMDILKIDNQLTGSKITVFFKSNERVDFRELIKQLANGLRARVELKQVIGRDIAKITGGIGICGKQLCCSTFLRKYDNISIKMARDQNLMSNPNKVSGLCGRLFCCLKYEDYCYKKRWKNVKIGKKVKILSNNEKGILVKCNFETNKFEIQTNKVKSTVGIDDFKVITN